MNCYYCKDKGIYKKRLLKSWHYSGALQKEYEEIMICDSDKCFDILVSDRNEDKKLFM